MIISTLLSVLIPIIINRLKLSSQLRCLGGDDCIQYIHEVLNVGGFGHPGIETDGNVLRESALRKAHIPEIISGMK